MKSRREQTTHPSGGESGRHGDEKAQLLQTLCTKFRGIIVAGMDTLRNVEPDRQLSMVVFLVSL